MTILVQLDHEAGEKLVQFKQKSNNFFNENGKFLHHVFSNYLVRNEHIIRLDERLYIYDDGQYVADNNLIKRKIIDLIPTLRNNNVREVMERLVLIAENKEHAPPRYINVKNGIYDMVKNKLLAHNPSIIITNKINAIYDPAATCKHIDNLLETISVNDKEVIQLIKEMIGYTFYRRNSFEKAFLLKGDGGNGKSTLLKAINSLLDKDNVSSLSLSELGERFNTGLLNGKLANVGDDIDYSSIKDSSIFKKLATGDTVKGEFKGETPFYFNSFATLIFSTNKVPRVYDNSQALKDRLSIVPLNARIRNTDKQDPFFEDKITTEEARSYLLNIGIKALNDLLKRGSFIIPKVVQKELDQFEVTNNPVSEWLHEYKEDGKDIHMLPVGGVYNDYKAFCEHNGYKNPLSNKALTMELQDNHGYKVGRPYIGGKQQRAYIEVDNNKDIEI